MTRTLSDRVDPSGRTKGDLDPLVQSQLINDQPGRGLTWIWIELDLNRIRSDRPDFQAELSLAEPRRRAELRDAPS